MTTARVLLVVIILAAVGVVRICLRQEMAETANRVQKLQQQITMLEQSQWSRQMDVAALRVPARLRERVDGLSLSVEMPKIVRTSTVKGKNGHGAPVVRD